MNADGWCILRTARKATLALAEHLASGGFEVWTPSRVFIKRTPRRKLSREVVTPILPTFVFARASHVHALLILSESPTKSCPDFSVFKQNGGIPIIPGIELAPLQFIEKAEADRLLRQRAKGSKATPLYSNGNVVRINGGSFAGMSGIVHSDDGRFAEISFGTFKVKISTFLLRNDMANHGEIAA